MYYITFLLKDKIRQIYIIIICNFTVKKKRGKTCICLIIFLNIKVKIQWANVLFLKIVPLKNVLFEFSLSEDNFLKQAFYFRDWCALSKFIYKAFLLINDQ